MRVAISFDICLVGYRKEPVPLFVLVNYKHCDSSYLAPGVVSQKQDTFDLRYELEEMIDNPKLQIYA